MSDLPAKPRLLPFTLTEYIRLARFRQDVADCRVLIQPVRRFHRKPPTVISEDVADVWEDD